MIMKKKYPSAVLLINEKKNVNLFYQFVLKNLGYKRDIFMFDDPGKAIDYLIGITSYFLPKPKNDPSFLVILDLKLCLKSEWDLLNQFLTFPIEKREWFSFIVVGSEEDNLGENRSIMYKYVKHYESNPLNPDFLKRYLV